MACTSCGEQPKGTNKDFTKAVIEINNPEQLVLLRKVSLPASMGTEEDTPASIGKYRNVLLVYEANGHIYLYSSDGIPTLLSSDIGDLEEIEETIRELQTNLTGEIEAREAADTALNNAISAETTARQAADTNLQSQIDAITASSDVTDIVGTYAQLQAYDTSTLGDNDIIKVLQDESQNDETTYYRWSTTTQSFTLIGEEGPYYTKSQTDVLLNAKQDTLTAGTGIDITNNVISATSSGPTVVQTTGTSTTDVMSQNAVTSMVFADPGAKTKVRIGNSRTLGLNSVGIGYTDGSQHTSATGINAVAVGYDSTADENSSVAIGRDATVDGSGTGGIALGAYSSATTRGEMNIGSTNTSYGYNSSNYRLLTGLYDGQSAHDAATYGQVISYSAINGAGAPTTATEGKYVGQLYYDTTNEAMYFLKTIDTTTTPTTYTWEALGGGSSVNVVQTIGDSTTDVMSQNAVGKAIYDYVDSTGGYRPKIGKGASTGGLQSAAFGDDARAGGQNAVAVGGTTSAVQNGAIALGYGATTSSAGEMNIGTSNTSYGYNNTNYRLLTGVHDPVNAHDAVTKGYVDTNMPVITMTSTDPGEGQPLAANNFIGVYQ